MKKVFSKICKLRPKHYILVAASETHYACIYTIYQNVKLKATVVKWKDPTRDMNLGLDISNHSHCLALMTCNPPTRECFFNACTACPGLVRRTSQEVLDSSITDVVTNFG